MKRDVVYFLVVSFLVFLLSLTNQELKRNYEKGYADGLENQNELLKENKYLLSNNEALESNLENIWSRDDEICDRRLDRQKQTLLTLAYAYDGYRKIINGFINETKSRNDLMMDYYIIGNTGESGFCANRIPDLIEEAKLAKFEELGNICY